jgi:PD-(D/E)XK nuclease superfamily
MTSDEQRSGLGPQYPPDPPFRALMRRHQSWYRSTVLHADFGTGPKPSSATYYGNMLAAVAAEAGANFLTPEIFGVARARIAAGGGVEPFRCLRNMLSSQPMCFNLFGPLVVNTELATRMVGALLPGEVAEVLAVRIEYAPSPRHEYLDDATAFDAFVQYRRPSGEPAFLGIETKLTDSFSEKEYVKPAYVALTERDDSVWTRDAWTKLSHPSTNQLWRNQLLAEALRRHPASPLGSFGRSVVVRHPLDGECADAVVRYEALLADQASFLDWPLDEVVLRWRAEALNAEEREWLEAFALRYLDVEASEGVDR